MFMPIPRANVATTTAVKPGFRRSARAAYRKSCSMPLYNTPWRGPCARRSLRQNARDPHEIFVQRLLSGNDFRQRR
ncbi:MAG: hypothetical protein NTY53_14730, partial [Kiritimatiellaeota bacterium]|nr:hypothetical protein [Kiritimatiellota bacterium]